ncbi:TPA: hypothetical protein N0F65_002242 [Lagenidium giganteum]|uniref:SWIM-type domain-containing protein n=1 Tax=Lagenidium giganteum TaxID=4803 RepID=A0AAV2YUW7_9STRA|nr:TPA: hypothetical protein N0F65_002242 [Lagenidium giganteum]
MIVDEFGHGQVVQHSALETNSNRHMQHLNKIKVIERSLAQEKVFICLFHVLKYLSKKIRTRSTASCLPQTKMHCSISCMRSSTLFKGNTLKSTSKRLKNDRFFEYFVKNWDNSPNSWAKHTRQHPWNCTQFVPDVDTGFVLVKYKSETHKVQSPSCMCPFVSAMKLPCKHVIAHRKHLNEVHIVPIGMIDVSPCNAVFLGMLMTFCHKWRFCNVLINAVPFAYNDGPVLKAPKEELADASKSDGESWLTKAERYKEACRIRTPINEALASIPNKREFEAFA